MATSFEARVSGQATTQPSTTLTETDGSGEAAGPCSTAPLKASNREPWQGQSRVPPPALTVQPWCCLLYTSDAADE